MCLNITMRDKALKIFRYFAPGGSAVVVHVGMLFLFVELFHLWYVVSSMFAFLIAFIASFLLQKFWTFRNTSKEGLHKQAGVYFIVAVINLALNTFLIYIFVEYFNFHYLLGQIVASGLIAISSFFIYSKFIFHNKGVSDLSVS